jgi:hypothetical protein
MRFHETWAPQARDCTNTVTITEENRAARRQVLLLSNNWNATPSASAPIAAIFRIFPPLALNGSDTACRSVGKPSVLFYECSSRIVTLN